MMLKPCLQVRNDADPNWGIIASGYMHSINDLHRLRDRWMASEYFEPGASFRIVDWDVVSNRMATLVVEPYVAQDGRKPYRQGVYTRVG